MIMARHTDIDDSIELIEMYSNYDIDHEEAEEMAYQIREITRNPKLKIKLIMHWIDAMYENTK